MSVVTEQQQENHRQHSLISWLSYVTHKHHHHSQGSNSKAHFQFPATKQEITATYKQEPLTPSCCVTVKHNNHDPDSSLNTSHHISIFHRHNPPSLKKKHHHFLRHNDDSDVNSSDEQHRCKCCDRHRRSSSVNDADDEMSSFISVKTENNNNTTTTATTTVTTNSSGSNNSTTSTYTNNINEEHRRSFLSIDSHESSYSTISNNDTTQKSHREKSIYALPEDINDPNEGYKLLKEDGGLIDYDSSGFEADDEDASDVTRVVYNSTKVIIKNDLVKLALNGLFHSPIHDQPKRQILHVGCGDGSWCVNVAQLHPDWLVIGMDDKTGGPIQDHRKVPHNFKYIRCYYDILKTIEDMPDHSFDLIYCRFLIYSYNEEDYVKLVSEFKRICKVDGYVELVELDMSIYGNPIPGAVTRAVNANVFHAMEERGLNPLLARKIGDILLKTFSIKEEENNKTLDMGYTSLPLGLWGGRMGVLFRDDINELFQVIELSAELHHKEKYNEEDSGDSSDQSSVASYSIEVMDEELETYKAFMNLHHAFVKKIKE